MGSIIKPYPIQYDLNEPVFRGIQLPDGAQILKIEAFGDDVILFAKSNTDIDITENRDLLVVYGDMMFQNIKGHRLNYLGTAMIKKTGTENNSYFKDIHVFEVERL